MNKAVIIVAGGNGSRMKSDLPKQFLKLKNEPILMHSIRAFYSYDASIQIVLVLPKEQQDYWSELCVDYSFNIAHTVTTGGTTRFHSVKNGLDKVKEDCIVGVHDGVRPLVSEATLQRCYNTAENLGNAVPVTDAIESIRVLSSGASQAVHRTLYKMVQTPQVFKHTTLCAAYQQAFEDTFTDDASVVEKLGDTINLVEGNRENIKITTPMDLKIGESLL